MVNHVGSITFLWIVMINIKIGSLGKFDYGIVVGSDWILSIKCFQEEKKIYETLLFSKW